MALIDLNLGSGENSDANLNTILTVGLTSNVVIYSCIFTNLSSNLIVVDVYLNDGSDRLLETVRVPSGSGNALSVSKLIGTTLSGGQAVKIQASSSDSFNYKLNGAERT